MRSSDKDRESRKQRNESSLDEINGLNDRIRSKRQQVETRKQDLDRLINDRRCLNFQFIDVRFSRIVYRYTVQYEL